jgi:hypothetical protein
MIMLLGSVAFPARRQVLAHWKRVTDKDPIFLMITVVPSTEIVLLAILDVMSCELALKFTASLVPPASAWISSYLRVEFKIVRLLSIDAPVPNEMRGNRVVPTAVLMRVELWMEREPIISTREPSGDTDNTWQLSKISVPLSDVFPEMMDTVFSLVDKNTHSVAITVGKTSSDSGAMVRAEKTDSV